MVKKRFKNYGLWVSLISALLLAAQQVGVLFGYHIDDATVQGLMNVVNTVLGVLVLLGIISNPTKPGGQGYNL